MSDLSLPAPMPPVGKMSWLNRLAASRRFQKWAARFPLTKGITRREGEAMFDLVAGFCHSQVLAALVTLDIPARLLAEPATAARIARQADMPVERMVVLLNAGCAIGLLNRDKAGLYTVTTRGAALTAVPGLADMIRHHAVLYRDLADPVAFFRGETETELAAFWPYVFGAGAAADPAQAATYSKLMTDSQMLVAEDTLAAVRLHNVRSLMDVGGGTGAFLTAVGQVHPALTLTLFDLPAVVSDALARFETEGLGARSRVVAGSFRDEPLPQGHDMISLVRVLYDHADATVLQLLRAVHAALPTGGRVLISEPMTGKSSPTKAGDAYFALYCMAMRTGRARSASEITTLLQQAGFGRITSPATARPFITSVLEAVKLD